MKYGGHRRAATGDDYWQASQVPPLSMASIEQAFFSAAVYCLASAAVAAV